MASLITNIHEAKELLQADVLLIEGEIYAFAQDPKSKFIVDFSEYTGTIRKIGVTNDI